MMLVSMVGHASFQTAGRSGPSIIERSYRGRCEPAAAARVGAGVAVAAGTAASVNYVLPALERAIIASMLHAPPPANTRYRKMKQKRMGGAPIFSEGQKLRG
jgi:hypothetical protein